MIGVLHRGAQATAADAQQEQEQREMPVYPTPTPRARAGILDRAKELVGSLADKPHHSTPTC